MGEKRVSTDYALLVECAESFQKTGELFIDSIRQRYPEGSSLKPPSGLGELVCCATNLGFGLELYLKALLVKLGEEYPRQHDLSKLYAMLPVEVKESVERVYEGYLKSVPAGVHASITVAKGPRVPPKWPDYVKEPKDLTSVLYRSRDLFRSWRYLFEIKLGDEGSYEVHEFEYRLLQFACKALRTQLKPKRM